MSVCVHESAGVYRPEESARSRLGVIGGCESREMGAGTELRSSERIVCDLNLCALSPAHFFFNFQILHSVRSPYHRHVSNCLSL